MSALVWVFLPLLLAYATAIVWCVESWLIPDGYFGHGPLVPVIMAVVIWLRRSAWIRRPASRDDRGFWLLGPALLLHLCGAALTIDSLSAASMVLAVPGAAWLALGPQRLQGLWPVLWLPALAVPLPLYVTGRLSFELKEIAVRGGIALANWTGLEVVRDGAFLQVPGQSELLDVADPCGGLRSLLAMVTLVYCIAFFTGPPLRGRRLLLLSLAAPIAIAVNMVRIAAICWVASAQGVPFAAGTGHDLLNAAAWLLDLGIVLGLDALLFGARAGPEPAPTGMLPRPPRPLRPAGIALWLCAVPLLWLSLHRPNADSRGRADALPPVIGTFVQTESYMMTERYFQLLGTRDASWRRFVAVDGESVYVVALFHGSNWKSVHPPHICLVGSDMQLVDERAIELPSVPDGRAGRLLLRLRRDGRPYLSLFVYGDRELCTASYTTFFLHHAPRALLRASNDGFLLRVEAYADGEGGEAAAEARCRDLLAGLIAVARGQLQ